MDFLIRQATEDGVEGLAHIHNEGWRAAYKDLLDHPDFNVPSLRDRQDQWNEWIQNKDSITKLAMTNEGNVAGLASYGRLKTPPPGMSPIRPLYSAELYGLYLLPDYYRQGLGSKLVREAACDLKDMKHNSLCVWTIEKNKRGMAFYKAMGGERCGKHMISLGPHKVYDICYGWRDTAILL